MWTLGYFWASYEYISGYDSTYALVDNENTFKSQGALRVLKESKISPNERDIRRPLFRRQTYFQGFKLDFIPWDDAMYLVNCFTCNKI